MSVSANRAEAMSLWHTPASKPVHRLTYRYCEPLAVEVYRVQCFFYRTDSSGGHRLPVALLSKNKRQSEPTNDVLVIIPGGPGQGFMTDDDSRNRWLSWMKQHQQSHDILLYDPRGTGQGEKVWDCKQYHALQRRLLGADVRLEDEVSLVDEVLEACLRDYQRVIAKMYPKTYSEAPLGNLSLAEQAADIMGIVDALGYQSAHLWGTSYGTRVALAAAGYRQVKTLILDSPYPFERGHWGDWATLYQNSFTLFQTVVERAFSAPTVAYEGEYRAYRDVYLEALHRLENKPLVVILEHWLSGEDIVLALTPSRLLELHFSMLYDESMYRPFYLGLKRFAESGDVNRDFQTALEYFVSNIIDPSFNVAVYFAVECIDNFSINSASPRAAPPLGSKHRLHSRKDSFDDVMHYFDINNRRNICDVIAQPAHTTSVPATNAIDKPTLIFTGEFDPVTPVTWARSLDRVLPRSRLIEVSGAGHSVLSDGACRWSFVNAFTRSGDVNVPVVCTPEGH